MRDEGEEEAERNIQDVFCCLSLTWSGMTSG